MELVAEIQAEVVTANARRKAHDTHKYDSL